MGKYRKKSKSQKSILNREANHIEESKDSLNEEKQKEELEETKTKKGLDLLDIGLIAGIVFCIKKIFDFFKKEK